ncbi:MAG: hypothetical protein AAGA48_03435 [Myxococcota bacterium]
MSGPSCSLPDSEAPSRRAWLKEKLVLHRPRVAGTDRKVRFEIPDATAWLALAELVEAERQCCRDLDFELRAPAHQGPVQLIIRGPRGTKAFLASWLPDLPELNSAPRRSWWRPAVPPLLGAAGLALCCVTPAGLAVATLLGISPWWFDAFALLLVGWGMAAVVLRLRGESTNCRTCSPKPPSATSGHADHRRDGLITGVLDDPQDGANRHPGHGSAGHRQPDVS